mgnify:CR=1 FL=1
MFIQTESTPNPATLKFLPGQSVLAAGTADFPNEAAAEASPLAARIFATGNVTGVFFGPDFVTVTKADGVEWAHIKPGILGAIMEHFQSGRCWAMKAARSAMRCMTGRMVKSSTRSRNCWTHACARPWRRMAATSPFMALTVG